MGTDVKIENRTQFLDDFHENVPFQSDENAEDQLQWMAMHAHEYPDSTDLDGRSRRADR